MKNYQHLLYLVSFFLFVGTGCQKEPVTINPPVTQVSTTFANPVRSSGPDPWIAQKGDIYYYTHTSGNRIDLYKTGAVSQLSKAAGRTVWTPPASGAYSRNIWAPELHQIGGKWYFYFAADDGNDINHRMYALENSSADPTLGNWEFKGKVAAPSDRWAIDGTILQHNNELYFLWSGWRSTNNPGDQQIYIARMANPWTIEGERIMLSQPTFPWETNGMVNEGPQVLKNAAGQLFIVYSASGCWTDEYALGLLQLKEGGNPLNPSDWMKHPSPVFSKKPEHGAYGPGHNGFFKSPDGTQDWIIYHANSFPGQGCGDTRNTRIQPFTWNADGTPHFGEPVKINTELPKPSGEVK